jgi:hypothetical protein
MMADQIRAQTPIDSERTITYRPADYSSRTAEIYATIIDRETDTLIVGVHPHMYAIPFARIVAVR